MTTTVLRIAKWQVIMLAGQHKSHISLPQHITHKHIVLPS